MKTIEDIKQYAIKNYVPIAREPLVHYLIQIIQQRNYHSMFEIGTGIAYTCIKLCTHTSIEITTIEHSKDRYQLSLQNITDFHLNHRINLIMGDAQTYETSEKFDVIFIDAAKLKNKLFFEKFSPLLKENGIIIIDNMKLEDFAKHVKKEKYEKYLHSNQELITYLQSLTHYNVQYLDIGDGILQIEYKK